MEKQLHSFLDLVRDGGEWSPSRFVSLNPSTRWTGVCGSHSQCECIEAHKFVIPSRNHNVFPRTCKLWAVVYTYWATVSGIQTVINNIRICWKRNKSVRHLYSNIHGVLVPKFGRPAGSLIETGTCDGPNQQYCDDLSSNCDVIISVYLLDKKVLRFVTMGSN